MKSARYAAYDWMQRIYTAFLPLVAWAAFSSADVAHFRIAYLFYALASTASVYLGSAIFNRMARADDTEHRLHHLAEIAGYLLLIVPPLSAIAKIGAIGAVGLILPPAYALSIPHLAVLTPWLVLPAAANFMREAMVGGGQPERSMWSYAITILLTTAIIFWLRGNGTLILSVGTLIGEAGGFLLLAAPMFVAMRKSIMLRLGGGILAYWVITTIAKIIVIATPDCPQIETLAAELAAAFLTGAILIIAILKLEARILTIPSR
jgi:hypothetical protein